MFADTANGKITPPTGKVFIAITFIAATQLELLATNAGGLTGDTSDADYEHIGTDVAAHNVSAGSETAVSNKLNHNLDRMRAVLSEKDTTQYYELNIEFHEMLLKASRNSKAQAIYESLVKEMHLYRRRGLSIATNIASSIEEHTAISVAVIAGDADAARSAAHTHVTAGFARYMKILDQDRDSTG